MTTKAYNSLDHTLYIKDGEGNTFSGQGEPDSDFIGAEFVNDSVTSVEGAKGDVQDSIRVAKMGRVTFTNQWGSDFNSIMNHVYKQQKKGTFMTDLWVQRTNANTGENVRVLTSTNPKIVKLPNYNLGVSASDRAYVFNVHGMTLDEEIDPAD